MKPPRTIQSLAEEAKIREPPSAYTAKIWTQTSLKLMDAADQGKAAGDLALCFTQNLRAMSIITEIIPKCREYNRMDPLYKEARERVGRQVASMEAVRKALLKQYDDFYKIRIFSSSDIFNEFRHSFREPGHSIVLLDFRPMEVFIDGHLKWARHPNSRLGGVVHIEPEVLAKSCSMDDLKSNMDMFSSAESDMKSRFQQLKSHLLVVVYDQKSQSLEPDSSLMRLLELLKNDQVDAIFLSGGYEGFMSFIKEGRYNTRDFIEIGIDGKSSHQSSSSIQSKPTLTATRKSVSNLEPSVKMKGDSAPVAPIGSPEPSFLQSLANIELSGSELVRSSYQVGLGARGKARSSNGSSAREALTGVNSSLTPPSREGSGGQIARNVSDYVTKQGHSAPPPYLNFNQSSHLHVGEYTPTSRFNFNPGHSFFAYGDGNLEYSPREAAIRYPEISPNQPPVIPEKSRIQQTSKPCESSLTPTFPERSSSTNLRVVADIPNRGSGAPENANVIGVHARRSSSPTHSSNNYHSQQALNHPRLPPKPSQPLVSHIPPTNGPRPYGRPPLPPKPVGVIGHPESPSKENVSRRMSMYSELGSTTMGVVGLKNIGNTCYINSILQCLSGTVPLSRYFLSGSFRRHINRYNKLSSKGKIAEAFAELLRTMWSAEDSIVTPTRFKQIVEEYASQFRGSDQHDSQEFLAFLLDAIHEDVNLASDNMAPSTIPDDDEDPDRNWMRYTERNWSIIVDMFQGQLRSVVQCQKCGKASITYNTFMYLSLPIPKVNRNGVKDGPVTLNECLDLFAELELLDGDNKWCKTLRKSSKKLSISKLPPFLMIHLKRFYHQGPFMNKIETHVEFPLNNLDMTNYHNDGSGRGKYDLYAVTNQYGGLNSGHYTSLVKNPYKQTWLNFDDSRISGTDKVTSEAAYILFYVQQSMPGMDLVSGKWWR
ncbi:MAG: hypothetical protein SGCHY_001201 [Lobulomycetales sp.]